MRWAISGGAGFLGLHLARRLLADGHEVRTLDVAPLDDTELEREVEELRGDVRDPSATARLAGGADVLVHAAAALPIQASRESIRSVNVDGAATMSSATKDVAGETFNVGAAEFGTVRSDLEGLIAHAGSGSRLQPFPARPAELGLRALEVARLSPLAEWHYRTAHRDSYVDISKAQKLLGYAPRLSNEQALCETYDWYLANREGLAAAGVTHRVPWDQRALGLLKRLS